MGVVVFDPAVFKARFSEFAAASNGLLESYFAEATLLLDNTDNGRVVDVAQRAVLLNLLTAHIAKLNLAAANNSGLVGRVASATEGSVSVSADYGTVLQGQAYYIQTPYGAQYWAMTAKYRTMRYVTRCNHG